MSSGRHPSPEALAAYAAGSLRPAFALVAAAHIRGCPHCRADIGMMEEVGGLMLDELPAAEMASDALDRALARLDRAAEPIVLPGQARIDLVKELKLKRRRWLAPGVWMAPVELEGAGDDLVYLLRVPPRARTFEHGHNGMEFTTILKGSYRDRTGGYRAGDFQEIDAGVDHQPVAGREGECLCLIASEAPMRMHSRLGRLAQLYMNV
jgi:putative transcriptional regulator